MGMCWCSEDREVAARGEGDATRGSWRCCIPRHIWSFSSGGTSNVLDVFSGRDEGNDSRLPPTHQPLLRSPHLKTPAVQRTCLPTPPFGANRTSAPPPLQQRPHHPTTAAAAWSACGAHNPQPSITSRTAILDVKPRRLICSTSRLTFLFSCTIESDGKRIIPHDTGAALWVVFSRLSRRRERVPGALFYSRTKIRMGRASLAGSVVGKEGWDAMGWDVS